MVIIIVLVLCNIKKTGIFSTLKLLLMKTIFKRFRKTLYKLLLIMSLSCIHYRILHTSSTNCSYLQIKNINDDRNL